MQPLSQAELIRTVGTALFGAGFQHELAAVLDVNRRTVARWVAGTIEPRAWVWPALLRLIEERQAELGEIAKIIASRSEPEEPRHDR